MPDISCEPNYPEPEKAAGVKPYRAELLALVAAYTDADRGQMTLTRKGPDTHPDPAKTSWNDTVSWGVSLTFGRGYFTGAVVRYTGRWTVPHPIAGNSDGYDYYKTERDLPAEEAVDQFLSDTIPEWVTKSVKE